MSYALPEIQRLPAIPLIVNDPYFSIWMAADRLTDANTTHWTGAAKPVWGLIAIDGRDYAFLGRRRGFEPMQTTSLRVTPTATTSTLTAGGVCVQIRFTTPLLMDQPDILSMPVTYVDVTAQSADGQPHDVRVRLVVSEALCYDARRFPQDPEERDATTDPGYLNAQRPSLLYGGYRRGPLNVGYVGRTHQGLIGASGDGITIDWGYAYLASTAEVKAGENGLEACAAGQVTASQALCLNAYAAYDDIVSINYFGRVTPAYYARGGMTILDAIDTFHTRRGELMAACQALDEDLMDKACALGGEDYAQIVCAAYRHTIAAHKLIADEEGNLVFLSK